MQADDGSKMKETKRGGGGGGRGGERGGGGENQYIFKENPAWL